MGGGGRWKTWPWEQNVSREDDNCFPCDIATHFNAAYPMLLKNIYIQKAVFKLFRSNGYSYERPENETFRQLIDSFQVSVCNIFFQLR